MTRIKFIILFLTMAFISCRAPTVMLNHEIKDDKLRVAVLTFSNSGFLSRQNFGKFAADEVARQLFLQKKALVVDRAIVNAVAANTGFASSNMLHQNQIQKMAKILDAQILITGEVRNLSLDLATFTNKQSKLVLNFRLIDPGSGIVLGVFTKETQGSVEEEQLIKEMIKNLVKRINELKIEEREASSD